MRAPIPEVPPSPPPGGVDYTFRMGVALPESATDCKGTVVPRVEIRAVNEELLRSDFLGDRNSMNVPPTSGHEVAQPPIVFTHPPPRPNIVPPSKTHPPKPSINPSFVTEPPSPTP